MMFRCSSCLMDHPGIFSESCSLSKYKYKFSRCASFKNFSGLKSRESSAVELSFTFRRALSESNLMLPLIRNGETNQRIGVCHLCRVMQSRKNGLLIATDRLVMMNSLDQESHDENSSSFGEVQSERDMIHHSESHLEEHKNQVIQNSFDFVDSGSMSENSVMAENWFGLKAEQNGMALVCTERGCGPAPVCEIDHKNEGSDIQDGGDRGRGEEESSGTESSSTDLYYQKMLEANPDNPLLLRNYAKFLHEVQHDMKRAEEYFSRAILASPGDGEIMSLYAKFIWESHKDLARTETYFERAVEATPADCYVIAFYAHFLWTCEDNEEENDHTIE